MPIIYFVTKYFMDYMLYWSKTERPAPLVKTQQVIFFSFEECNVNILVREDHLKEG